MKNSWQNISVDFDKYFPQESIGQKLKINSISI